jgi:hypothetical protein
VKFKHDSDGKRMKVAQRGSLRNGGGRARHERMNIPVTENRDIGAGACDLHFGHFLYNRCSFVRSGAPPTFVQMTRLIPAARVRSAFVDSLVDSVVDATLELLVGHPST